MTTDIIWPAKYLPGSVFSLFCFESSCVRLTRDVRPMRTRRTTDNYVSNEVIVQGLTAEQVWPLLADITKWESYYSNWYACPFYSWIFDFASRSYRLNVRLLRQCRYHPAFVRPVPRKGRRVQLWHVRLPAARQSGQGVCRSLLDNGRSTGLGCSRSDDRRLPCTFPPPRFLLSSLLHLF